MGRSDMDPRNQLGPRTGPTVEPSGGPVPPVVDQPDGSPPGPSAAGQAASAWEAWLATPPGQYVMRWERERLGEAVVDMFGYFAVQLGFLELDALAANRMPHRIRVSLRRDRLPEDGRRPDLIVGSFGELPLDSQSVDLVVLPHQLEFCEDPHQVLREADRVLRPEGRLVITGLNPISLWGLRESATFRPFAPFLPPTGQFISMPRLRDWMKLLSFEIDSGHYGCYVPPCRTQKWLDRMRFMERAGDRWWPICGAVYMVSAVKRVRGMRLVGPAWKLRRATKPAPAVAVSGRSVNGRTYSRESAVVLPFRRRP